ncbi:hypothetical protein D1871_22980 [Nakamurella silvestris]|nr:hypothetical protein D1871_22980 [Nakamurella silvestris]
MDSDVVGAVAGESVEFVDDAVLDLAVSDEFEHSLQFGAVGFACGLACVDEFGDHGGVQRFGFADVGLALGGYGEALFAAAALGLLFGRDTQVGDRREQRCVGAR